ncbi:MAG: hypothetical protein COA81_11655 [Alphaproteobacteria bacterium]|nr:MAG: hypothetical protein COA81_11655 [Alphaproteobacteria bacterium]
MQVSLQSETIRPVKQKTENLSQDIDQILSHMTARITESDIAFPINFTFIWHNITFTAKVTSVIGRDDYFALTLTANLGYLPFSAEDAARRKNLLERFAQHFITGKYVLLPNSRIERTLTTDFTGPVNARRLMDVITFTLLDQHTDLKSAYFSITGAVGNTNF